MPSAYNPGKKWPVVVMFHGGGGTARAALRETGWAEKADKEGFLVAFPEGTPPDLSRAARFRDNPQTWNDGSKRASVGAVQADVPDVEFVSTMLADIKLRVSVEERRVYATGFSNGASMTFRVVRELSRVLAAAAPVAGADWMDGTMPERPVPILYITGTTDPLNPMGGGSIRIGRGTYGEKPPIQEMIGRWVKICGCREEPRVLYGKDGATGVAYGRSGDTESVVLYTIDGHGHYWPGGKSALPGRVAGENTAKLKATDVIWEFFKAHSSVGATVQDIDGNTYPTVVVGRQVWLGANLRTTRAPSGAPLITHFPNNDSSTVPIFGRLYAWEAAQAACPRG
ncbi:MAG: CE1 family esterase [Gemmatimonadaceae bacterium]